MLVVRQDSSRVYLSHGKQHWPVKDWLADGLVGRAPKIVSTQREVVQPLIDAGDGPWLPAYRC
jgi:hypothetical protein